ncbi:MAG: MarR family transcriptional regulator [Nitrospirota bacterium]|nr:MAG: MarR family transcriptional regulator [Nitrospirota bacterium]
MKNNYKPTDRESRSLGAYVKLMRAAESVTVRVHGNLAGTGLTVSQFGVLEALYNIGPMTQKEVGAKILKSSGNITMVIDNLEKRGLVKRTRSSEDRRAFVVSLTNDGYALIDDIFPEHARVITRELGVLSIKEQVELARLCKKLGLSLG